MARKSDVLLLPVVFPNAPEFRLLQARTQEDAATLLGRVLAVALAVASQQRTEFAFAELDAVACWRPRPETFGEMLEAVGWALVHERRGLVEVKLPEALQQVNKRRTAGEARARNAKRDGSGRYLPAPASFDEHPTVVEDGDHLEARKRKATRPRKKVDADGQVEDPS